MWTRAGLHERAAVVLPQAVLNWSRWSPLRAPFPCINCCWGLTDFDFFLSPLPYLNCNRFVLRMMINRFSFCSLKKAHPQFHTNDLPVYTNHPLQVQNTSISLLATLHPCSPFDRCRSMLWLRSLAAPASGGSGGRLVRDRRLRRATLSRMTTTSHHLLNAAFYRSP